MSVKHFIPNFVTLLNLFCGCIAVILAVQDLLVEASFFVFLGIFFDFFDGLLARKLQVQSELGVQLDSLADMVTSGVVPGIVMFKLFQLSGPQWAFDNGSLGYNQTIGFSYVRPELHFILPLFGLLITLASAYRLAKFNIDDEQKTYFKGLPTPANTLLVLSLPLILEFQNNEFFNSIILNIWFLISFTLISCYLMNSQIRLLALKFKTYSFTDNLYRYILIMSSLVFIILLKFVAIPVIILFYIVLSAIQNRKH